MCFSAEVSFTTAALLAIEGIVCVRRFHKKALLLSLIPLFFALQQFSEGMIWVAFNENLYPNSTSHFFQTLYLFFAYAFWPVWIPLAFLFVETSANKRMAITLVFFGGLLIFLYDTIHLFFLDETQAQIIGSSINYGSPTRLILELYYTAIVLAPFFISSIPRMQWYGIFTGIAFLISHYFYTQTFTSVWCFFAAALSLGLIFILKSLEVKKSHFQSL